MTSLGPTGATRVLVATRPVDFRKGMDGLAALVTAELGGQPYSGVVYVFRAKKADRIKLVWWDGTGLTVRCDDSNAPPSQSFSLTRLILKPAVR